MKLVEESLSLIKKRKFRSFVAQVKSGQVDGCGASETAGRDERAVRPRLEENDDQAVATDFPEPVEPRPPTTAQLQAAPTFAPQPTTTHPQPPTTAQPQATPTERLADDPQVPAAYRAVADTTRRTLGPRHPFRLVRATSGNGGFVIKAECFVCRKRVKAGGGSGKNPTLQNFLHHHVEKPTHQKNVRERFGADENDPTAGKLKKPEPRKRKALAASAESSAEVSAEVSAGGAAHVSSSTTPSQAMTVARARSPQDYKDALLNLQQSDPSPSSWFHLVTCRVSDGKSLYCCTRCPKRIPCNPGVEGAVRTHLKSCKFVPGQTTLSFASLPHAPAESSSASALNVAPTTDACTASGSSASAAAALSF